MIHSRITAKAQTTIPRAVRQALGVGPGDELAYAIERGRVTMTNPKSSPAATDPSIASGTRQHDPAVMLATLKRIRRRALSRTGGGISVEEIVGIIREDRARDGH